MIGLCTAIGFSALVETAGPCNVDSLENSIGDAVSACFDVQNKMAESPCSEKGYIEPKFIYLDEKSIETHKGMFRKAKGENVYVFDIDETLYPHDDNIVKARKEMIIKFGMLYGLSSEEALNKTRESLVKYKSTIKGFIRELPRNEHVIEALHNPIPNATDTLKPDNELRKMLQRINGRKVCLTNGPKLHSRAVLEKLGVLDCFEAVFCCDYHNPQYLSKPVSVVYYIVSRVLEVDDTSHVYFFDDRYENIASAIPFGWRCFHVTKSVPLKRILSEILEKKDEV
eukprot:jgi/Antlo1/12/2032